MPRRLALLLALAGAHALAAPPDAGLECPPPTVPLVGNGGTLKRGVGRTLSIQFAWQGERFGLSAAHATEAVMRPSDRPRSRAPGKGYWLETRNAADETLFTRELRNPAFLEGPRGQKGLGWSLLPRCLLKSIAAEVPNDPLATVLLVFGMPYGTPSDAIELGRFSLSAPSETVGRPVARGGCRTPPTAMLQPGEDLPWRPKSALLRFTLLVQGELVSVFRVSAPDGALPPAPPPPVAPAYWLETRTAQGKMLSSRWFRDPARLESRGADGGLTITELDPCIGQFVDAEVPNEPAARTLVVLRSADGSRKAALELTRFPLGAEER